ncbi:hypothetical protein [Vibrio fortis]|uniref:hypothetical protein n=1 Tax=Vibrio fortis TaxID=212667 RepID=UPI003EB9384A
MVKLIEKKKALLNERTVFIKKTLEELRKSNSTFPSSRKLSEYLAQKMEESGKPVDSSTFRRKGSPYKELIDGYVGKKEERADTKTRLDLKIREKNTKIQKLTSRLETMENELKNKEQEICLLLVEAQDKRKKAIASIAPPQASTYTQTELTSLKDSLQRDRAQLGKALEVIDTLLRFELKTNENSEGSYEIKGGKVIDLLNERDLFNEDNLPDFFKER